MANHGRTLGFMVMVVLMVSSLSQSPVHGAPQVPCFFIFGDSLADNGNNNNIPTVAKVNYPPYGIDFPAGATGRFTNGRTTVDILAQLLGFENPIPPAISTQGRQILQGLNYASGSAGIRSETGRLLGTHFSLDAQLVNHGATKAHISTLLGSLQAASNLLSKCLYSVGMGSNDYLNNYFVPAYGTGNQYTPEQYATVLINQYSHQIRTLYRVHGARKVALIGLGPIGCAPNSIAKYGTKGAPCVDNMNTAVQLFNQKLVALVDQLNAELTDAKFIYVNSFGMAQGDPVAAGFKVVNEGCCTVNMVGQCIAGNAPCPNRNEYVFWDGFHPTEASNTFTAKRTYTNAQPTDTHPMDISHLVQLAL